MYQPEDLRIFFEPDGVALIGTIETGPGSYNILEIMRDNGYTGRLYPVNPKGGMIAGEKVYPSVLDIPDPIELCIVSIPRTAVLDVVQQCLEKGIKGLIIVTQGFADADVWGKEAQKEIVRICRQAGVRVIGPNTMGVANNFNSFSSAFVRFHSKRAPVGIASQSGMFLTGSQSLACGMGLAADLGNTCDVNMAELLGYYGGQQQIKVISIHMEDVKDGLEFLRVAREVSRRKPIIVLKSGKSPAGAQAVGSHSGSLAGESETYDVAFRQAGILQVEDEEELCDLTKIFLTYPPLFENRVAIVTASGGAGIIALDACTRYGLQPAALSQRTREVIRSMSPEWLEPANPIDTTPAAMAIGYVKAVRTIVHELENDPYVDAILIAGSVTMPIAEAEIDPFPALPIMQDVSSRKPTKPVVFWFWGSHVPEHLQAADEMKIVAYPSIGRCMRALGALHKYGKYLKGPRFEPPEPRAADRIRASTILAGEPRIIGNEALEALTAYGLVVPRYQVVSSLEEAQKAALTLGFPLVLKVVSPDIIHKSDVGGVLTDIQNPEELAEACRSIQVSLREKAPEATIAGFLVQEQVSGGQEVILGIKRDSRFGPVVLFGLGGIFAEIVRDISFRIVPVNEEEARAMVAETRLAQLLQGARGRQKLDVDALIDCILAVSQMALDFPQIASLDINPLKVLTRGVVALDLRIEWQP